MKWSWKFNHVSWSREVQGKKKNFIYGQKIGVPGCYTLARRGYGVEGKGENSLGIGLAVGCQGKKFWKDTMKIGRVAKPQSEKMAEKSADSPSETKLAAKSQKFAH